MTEKQIIKKSNEDQFDLFGFSDEESGEVKTNSNYATLENTNHNYTIVQGELGTKLFLQNLLNQTSVCFDTETTGIDALNAELVGLSFSWEKGKAFYVPFSENQDHAQQLIEKFRPFFENQDIEAWSIATDTQYALKRDPTTRVGLSANVASGDRSPNDNKFGTFNAMFPRGNYFSELATLGPRNFYNVQPYFTLQPLPAIEVTTAVNFYWRLSTKDGVYGPGGNALKVDSGSDLRYVATEFSFTTTFNYTDATKLSLVYGRSFPAALVQQTGNRGATDYFEITAKVLF